MVKIQDKINKNEKKKKKINCDCESETKSSGEKKFFNAIFSVPSVNTDNGIFNFFFPPELPKTGFLLVSLSHNHNNIFILF